MQWTNAFIGITKAQSFILIKETVLMNTYVFNVHAIGVLWLNQYIIYCLSNIVRLCWNMNMHNHCDCRCKNKQDQ